MLISSYEKNYGDNPEIVGDSGEKVDSLVSGFTFVVKEFSCNDNVCACNVDNCCCCINIELLFLKNKIK